MTVTVCVEALLNEATNMKWLCSPLPSATDRSAMEMLGGVVGIWSTSSLRIVPVPEPSAMVALTGEDSMRVSCSSSSTRVSPLTVTLTVFEVWPGVKVSDPTAGA